jgi:predicted dehydrogenase
MSTEHDATSSDPGKHSRREFLKRTGTAAAASMLAGVTLPGAFAQGNESIRIALIGCGGRGSGAAANALSAPNSPCTLYAMADLWEDRLNRSCQGLNDAFGEKANVPQERRFSGFDAYKQAIDALGPGDIALLTAYTYCRPLHLEYAVERGVNVFMEKPFASDPAGLKRVLAAGRAAEQKGLRIAGGLMCRHSVARQAFIERVRNGELGDIPFIRAYRMDGGGWLGRRPGDFNEVAWQISNRLSFPWVAASRMIDFMIHQVDECCWIMDQWPTQCHALQGNAPNNTDFGQNIDSYAMEFTYPDGSHAMVDYRGIPNCWGKFSTYVHGTERAGQFSGENHAATTFLCRDKIFDEGNVDWRAPDEPCGPHQAEWNVLLEKILNDEPHNETERCVMANYAAFLGRAAVHTGQIVTWDQMLASDYSYCDADGLSFESEAPVREDENGHYPMPIPGEWQEV